MAFSNAENDGNEPRSYRDQLAGQKANTRRRILQSARQVFLRSGFMDANLNEIAAGAGVGKGTLYRHFENKGELYVAMLSEHGQALAREMGAALEGGGSTRKQLEKIAAFYLEFWQRHPEHFQIIWAVQNRDLIGPLSADLMASLLAGVVAFVLMVFVYLPLALRRFYGQSRRWTAIKALAVLFVYSQLLGLAFDASVLVGIWGV